MSRRSWWAVALLAASSLLVPATAWAQDGTGEWEIEGTWIDRSVLVDGWGVLMTITRIGGNEYQAVADYAGPPQWPGEAKRSLMIGPLWKVGPQEWAWYGISYLLHEDGSPAWTLVNSMTWKMAGPDEIVTDDWWLLWKASGDRTHLVEAKRLLDASVSQMSAEDRASALANLRLNREIVAAAKEHGL